MRSVIDEIGEKLDIDPFELCLGNDPGRVTVGWKVRFFSASVWWNTWRQRETANFIKLRWMVRVEAECLA